MKEKLSNFWTDLKKKISFKRKDDVVFPLKIPVAGITEDQIIVNQDSGVLIVNTEQQIVVEEADRFRPSKMYSSFGFHRSIFLPEGIKIREIRTRIDSDSLRIGWPKKM